VHASTLRTDRLAAEDPRAATARICVTHIISRRPCPRHHGLDAGHGGS